MLPIPGQPPPILLNDTLRLSGNSEETLLGSFPQMMLF